MDLTIDDVAELLCLSETTVERWAKEGKIPSYTLSNEVRFDREEIDSWLLGNHSSTLFDGKEPSVKGGIQQYSLTRALNRGGIYQNVPGNDKESLIKNSAELISLKIPFDPTAMTELLLERERLMSTALNNGLAVPHTRESLLDSSYDAIALVFPKEPVDFAALDKKPVHALFFLFACDDRRHLNLLAKIAHFSRDEKNSQFLKERPNKQELLSTIQKWESTL